MASLRVRQRADGSTAFNVLYTFDGQQTSTTFDTRKEAEEFQSMCNTAGAERAMKAWDIKPTKQALARNKGPTVEQWLEHYIDHLTGVGKSTIWDYKSYARRDINPIIGQIALADLSGDDIRAWVKIASNRKYRGQLPSGKTIANKHGFLSAALNSAVKAELIPSNPAAGTRLPRTEKPEILYVTSDQLKAVLEAMPERWRPLTEFLVRSGARFNEAAALKPSDVDREKGTVRIVRAWKRTYQKGGYELGPPKTKRGVRTINVSNQVLDKLDYSGEWLFTTRQGKPVRISSFRAYAWWPAVAKAKLETRPRIHDLRHTCASWLIASGKPLPEISRHLGHESIQVTVDIYGHLDRSTGQALAAVFDDMLGQ